MNICNDPEERNSTNSKPSKIIYAGEYLLSLNEQEICRRLPEGIDESFLSEFRSSAEQGFSRECGSPCTIHDRVLLPPRQGSTRSISNDLEERNLTTPKPPKIIYARDYLVSLSELEICKRLPEGIDESFVSEFGSSAEQGLRRNELNSSAPGKGETGNFSRGFQRWDNRSSWRSDSNPQPDRESDSGRRYGNPFRRTGQNQEHDGLLGSGSVARPPGYGPGSSVSTSGANDQRQLSRSNDPYHPPRSYKAAPNSWRETKDSLNDETFGSAEATDEDRVEEERKRRAEFEMMRKEQQKELQERLKSKRTNKLKDDPVAELSASVDTRENAIVTIGLDTTLVKHIQENDSEVFVSSQGHPNNRPLMPPGFANAATKNICGTRSFDNSLEMKKAETEDHYQGNKSALQPRLDDKHPDKAFLWDSKSGKKVDISSASDLSSQVDEGLSSDPLKKSGLGEVLRNNQVLGIVSGNDSERKFVGNSVHSASILGKLFEGASTTQRVGPSNIIEEDNVKADIYLSPKDNLSSKFAQWFLEEERKPVERESLNKPNALFSLIVGEKSGSVASDTLSPKQILTPESKLMKVGSLAPRNVGVSGPVYNKNKPEYNSAVLTCEDLEQSIISDFGVSSSSSESPGVLYNQQHGLENEVPLADISNNASQHLLSLLQKGISSNSKTVPHNDVLVKGLPRDSLDMDSERAIQGNPRDINTKKLSSGKDLTLETLFGAAFMNELQSSDPPTSVQRNSVESSSIYVSEPRMQPVADSPYGPAYTSVTEARSERVDKIDSFLGSGAQQVESLCFDLRNYEENSLNSIGTFRKDERPAAGMQDSSPFSHDPFSMLKPEMPYQSMRAHSSPQFHPTMVNHGRPVFSPLDPHVAHIDRHFMPLEGTKRQDAAIHHPNSANLGHPTFRHPNSGSSQVDHSIHPILQQMRMSNVHSAAPLQPGIAHHPLHSGVYRPSLVQDQNLAHGFPYGQQQPNPVDLRVPQQGGQYRSMDNNPPQTYQSLVEMELRSNPKPRLPSFPGIDSRSRTGFGHEPDSSFWYR